ncbi:type II toxin-antitoxin system HipA family toxin [Acinetobacter schindleri]|uniref:type II toxin-antitoxin system HipA family toxin n=1 Tax=Acinetobacter schindleri TaxID=108981 RepID=UPI0009727591|nr:type II toxin-antitoxin system HipA family toxin [Acinetobacter schindleri]APX62753.1 HipA-like protein [Acinetobacter schindleri]
MDNFKLPTEIKSIEVFTDNFKQGLLTHSGHYYYQPVQEQRFVSLTMTLPDMQGYSHGALHPIFSQNLPEGHNRHFIASKLARYANVNEMYLLALQEANGIGMLSYKSELQLPEVEIVSLDEILNYNSQVPLFPQLLEKYYLRNSLAGVQPKVSIPNVTSITERTVQQKDLIVKSYDADFDLLTVNEFVCMEAARHCGLQPPKTYLSANLETYIIERFDKAADGTKLGYEDFTTLLKRSNDPNEKYKGSYENLLKATYLYTRSEAEVVKMYKYIVFNCLIGNGDAHLKNFALQYTPDMSEIFVSPPFDITHTLIYKNIDDQLALKINGSKQFPTKAELLKLAESPEFRIRNAKEIIEYFSDQIANYLKLSNEIEYLDGLRESIEQNLSKVMSTHSIKPVYRHDKKKKYK